MPSTIFAATNNSGNVELWRTNGTAVGTNLLKEIQAGSTGSFPSNAAFGSGAQLPFAVLNGFAYFSATVGGVAQLWRSNGTTAGTTQVTTFAGGTSPTNIVVANGLLFFVGNGAAGGGVYKSDGTNAGTVAVDVDPTHNGMTYFISTGNRVLLGARQRSGLLWSVDIGRRHAHPDFDCRQWYRAVRCRWRRRLLRDEFCAAQGRRHDRDDGDEWDGQYRRCDWLRQRQWHVVFHRSKCELALFQPDLRGHFHAI